MAADDYIRVLRKRWRLLVACVLVVVAAAGLFVWRTTPKYEASSQLFVAAKDAGSDLQSLAQGGTFTQQRVQSYADIVDSPQVTGPVAAQLRDGLTANQIAKEVSASAPLGTVLLDVHVSDTSPQRAQALANAVSAEFASYAAQLETTPGGARSSVKVTVVRPAQLPTEPVSPKTDLDLVLALIVGIALGAGIAVLRESLDTTVRDSHEIQSDFGLPTLGAIAYDPDAPKRPLVVRTDPHSPRAEAFRQLRTNLQFIDVDQSPRSIVITSSIPEEGKTTTATNLAIMIAQSGLRVVIVEGDLRRPRLGTYLGLEGAVGLTSVLIGNAGLDDAIQQWGDDGLHILPSGPKPPNPSELLGSQGMADVIHRLEESFDLVLIDAPPLLPVTDAAVIAAVSGGAILIVRHGHTKQKQLGQAAAALRAVDATVYGAVLTMVPTKGPDAYYYGYNYRYNQQDTPGRSPTSVDPGWRPKHAADGSSHGATPAINGSTGPLSPNLNGIAAAGKRKPKPKASSNGSSSATPATESVHEDPVGFFSN